MDGMKSIPRRNIVMILGDQLDHDSAAFDGFDPAQDLVLMVESLEESTHVWSHKVRSALFLTAMRHFSEELKLRGWQVEYRSLEAHADKTLADGLLNAINQHQPQRIIGVEPGDLRVRAQIEETIRISSQKTPLEWREDRHFLCSLPHFNQWAGQSASLRMEFFYRRMRKQYKVLMEDCGEKPIGGKFNFDAENRKGFGRQGPQSLPVPLVFEHDSITKDVIKVVKEKFASHPGDLSHFNWPVTRQQALFALDDFITHRLPFFGVHQDAMWTGMDFGWHALLSSSLNLKLLNPLEVVLAAQTAYRERNLDLASVEGFIRQVLGWREFMRGVYFLDMPALKKANHFGHTNALPKWYWTGETKMNCMRQSLKQTLANGYSHHIQRLMITGMFGVTAQIEPQQLCDWYLAVYVDAVEWVELPNTAGMALFANGGRFTSKPYVASGAYVKRMSNYCGDCAYSPESRLGPDACPMTTLYWNFLDAHEAAMASNPRTALMIKNLQRMTDPDRLALRKQATEMLANLDAL
jgi:deoxyribodipyrimidine photolyase-related protein